MKPLQFRARIFAGRGELFAAAARHLAAALRAEQTDVCAALAGGETPQPIYRALQQEDLPWPKISFYPTDERCAPAASSRRNDGMLRRLLGDAARVVSLEEGVAPPPLHIALLGMGEDGHIASLFAGEETDGEAIFRVSPSAAPEPRLTMPLSVFVSARKTMVLFCGEKKWAALSRPEAPISDLLRARDADIFYAP